MAGGEDGGDFISDDGDSDAAAVLLLLFMSLLLASLRSLSMDVFILLYDVTAKKFLCETLYWISRMT